MALLWIFPGCGEPTQPTGGGRSKDAAPALRAVPQPGEPASAGAGRSDGLVLFADRWLEVGPVIGHEPHSELSTQCRAKRDAAKRAGRAAPPLCYDPVRRARSAIDTIRLEIHSDSTPAALHDLASKDEAVHFEVEATGSIYQLLDLAYAPRRAGRYRRGEIRVLSAGGDQHEPLIGELHRLFPRAKLEVLTLPPSSPETRESEDPSPRPRPDASDPADASSTHVDKGDSQ